MSADRPGHGLSDFQPNRRLLDWPDDIGQLANHMEIDKFYVAGYSNGGPYALACAYRLPDRVVAGASISGVAPMSRVGAFKGTPLANRILNGSARWAPWLAKLIRRMMRGLVMNDVEKATQTLLSSIPDVDKQALYAAENIEVFVKSVREAFRPGWHGIAKDDIIVNQNWGFDVAAIKVRMDIWHGDEDVNVPCHAGQYWHDIIPNSRATFLPNEGHFLLLRHWSEVLTALVSDK